MDKISSLKRSVIMSHIKSKGSKLESKLFYDLWSQGFRFRKNVSDLFGKPDFSIKKYKIVIFIDSCFWHKCHLHCRMPHNNYDYWLAKLSYNSKRDKMVTDFYNQNNWNILRIWEHDLKNSYSVTVQNAIIFILKSIKSKK